MSDFLTRIARLSSQRLALLANELNERVQALEEERSSPVAIIGMGCRYPGGADGPESFWALLREGVDAIREVPGDRWDVDALYDPDPDKPGRMATRWGGFIEAPDRFDPKFFGIAPAEAVTMDPQQRLLLETAWEALENAGVSPASLAGTAAGVFVGVCNSDYAFHALRAPREKITAYFASGLSHAVASGRISYLLGLQGPSATIDTSCSASLMSVHLACQSLRRGESDLALAGGANLILNPEITIALSRSRMMAPDGRCKAFSDDADGFVRAEGSGIVVLRRLRDALAGRDRILAVIRGTAANQDGKSSGLTAPNGPSQEAVLRAALADAGMGPDDLQYIEAHGTGTALGDPIEVGALAQVFANRSREVGPLWTGSVKSNVGHLESAAGIAGLMKLVLALQHREIPATLHLGTPNRRIEWDALPVRLASRRERWPEAAGPRAGGVSSFGFSGTNVHVIAQEAPSADEPEERSDGLPRLVVLSAKTETALRQMAQRLTNWLASHEEFPFPGVARTLMAGRAHFEHRLAMAAGSCEEVVAKLRSFPDGDLLSGKTVDHQPRIGFVFAANGISGSSAMALAENVPVFRNKLRECEAIFSAEPGGSPAGWSGARPQGEWEDVPAEIRPAILVAEGYAFAGLLQSCGVKPAYVAGSGVGAIAAACTAGVIRIEDGLRLALAVGRGNACEVEKLSRTVPMEEPTLPWLCGDGDGLLAHWTRRALAMGASLPSLEQPQNGRIWVAIGGGATKEWLPHPHVSVASREGDGLEAFVRAAAELYVMGCSLDLSRLYGENVARTVALPTYPFERERYWLEVESQRVPERTGAADAAARQQETEEHDRSGEWLYEVAWEPRPRKGLSDEQKSIRLAAVLEEYVAAAPAEAVLRVGDAVARLQVACGGYALRSLERLGLTRVPGETFTLEELCDRLQIVPERARIAGRLVAILAEDGIVTRIGKRFRFMTTGALPDPDAEWAALDAQYPEIRTELKILKRCSDRTPAVLRGTYDPMQLVFAAGSVDEAEQIYEKSPICRYFNEAAREILFRAVSRIHGRTARILEIGAGTGATTASVLAVLAGQDVAYTFTDLSPVFLAKAREKFGAYRSVEYKLLNVERDPADQGFEKGGFDIVLAANVLHATASLRETVAHAQQLLRPGGVLMLIEGSRPDRWLDLTFGLTDGWWRFSDRELRREHPLVSSETWQELFREQGLSCSRAVRYTERRGEPSQQVLLAACADSAQLGSSGAANRGRRWMIFADQSGVGAELEGILGDRSEACARVENAGQEFDPEAVTASIGESAAEDELQVVYLWSLDAIDVEAAIERCAQLPVQLIQRLCAGGRKAKLWLVTRGAQAAGGSEPSAVSALQAMTWGIGRVLALEQPNLLGGLIDLDPDRSAEASAKELFGELAQPDSEDQIVFRNGQRLAPRLRHSDPGVLGRSVARLHRDGSYLVTGAFGKVGRRVTRWLAESGAGHLVLVSRTGVGTDGGPVTKERAKFVQEIQELGVPITVVCGDVALAETVERAFLLFGGECPPLRGVLHMATSQKMTELSRLTRGEMDEVLRAKVLGCVNLAHAVKVHQPDFFVSFSSTTALLGAQNMSAYAAANQFLDSYAAAQRALGRPMVSVNWGAWETSEETSQLRQLGLVPMVAETALAWLPRILATSRAQAMIADIDWTTLRALYESRRVRPILSEVGSAAAATDPEEGKRGNEAAGGSLQGASIAELVFAESARVLGFRGGDRPPPDVPLTDLGLDSLMAVDLRNGLQTALGRELPSTLVFDYPTVSKLTAAMETMAWAAAGNPFPNRSAEQDEVRI